jgi:hypothetical protein
MTVRSLSPRFKTVSIMPGIDKGAPERTEKSRGLVGSPKRTPSSASTCAIAASTCSRRSSG